MSDQSSDERTRRDEADTIARRTTGREAVGRGGVEPCDLRAMEGIEEFGKLSHAHTARDLMQRAVYVTMDDSVREAFSRMHERRLEGLPIVDEEMRVVGYLDRLQLIHLWRQKHRRGGGA